jgi:hypothetical protein
VERQNSFHLKKNQKAHVRTQFSKDDVESSDSPGYWIVDDDDFYVYGVCVGLAAKQKQ